jgi:transposase
MLLRKAYRFRIDPDAAQEELFRLTIGCCRLVYNLSLDQKISERERSDATLYSSKSAGLYSRLLSPQKPRTPARDALLATASRLRRIMSQHAFCLLTRIAWTSISAVSLEFGVLEPSSH